MADPAAAVADPAAAVSLPAAAVALPAAAVADPADAVASAAEITALESEEVYYFLKSFHDKTLSIKNFTIIYYYNDKFLKFHFLRNLKLQLFYQHLLIACCIFFLQYFDFHKHCEKLKLFLIYFYSDIEVTMQELWI